MDTAVQDLSHLQWRAPEYLMSLPTGQLSSNEFAMDYFTMSPFFDKHSNNNQLRMQLMFSRGGIQGVNEQEELKRFVGIEYVMSDKDSIPPNLFVIHKRNRTSPTTTTIISVYHILNANVYQAPTIYTVLNERILTSLHALESSMSDLIRLKPQWTPESLYHWNVAPPPVSSATKSALEQSVASVGTEQGETGSITVGDTHDHEGGGSRQRSIERQQEVEEGGEADEGQVNKKVKLSTDSLESGGGPRERDPEEFNPLLFRALQGVGRRIQVEGA